MPDINDVMTSIMRNDYYMSKAAPLAQKRLADAIDELERRIIKDVASLKTKGTNLVGPKVNLKHAQKIQKSLAKTFAETYGAEARQTVTGFKNAAKYVNNNWSELDAALAFTDIDSDTINTLGKQYYNEFNKFGKSASDTINTAMYNSIAGQQPHSELVKAISAALTGKYDKRGVPMSRYADQFAFDGMMNFSQAVNLSKAEEGGFDKYLYYGNVMTTTRRFCRYRVGNVYSRKEINSWTAGWEGKSGPAMTHRGGYNCRHHWQPVMDDWLEGKDVYLMRKESADRVTAYYMAMDNLAPYGVKPGSKGAQFVEALINKPMTNAEIKALPWNKTGNLHGDIFKKLKDKGLAGVTPQGKKWIKVPDELSSVNVPKPKAPASVLAKQDDTTIGPMKVKQAHIDSATYSVDESISYGIDGNMTKDTHILNTSSDNYFFDDWLEAEHHMTMGNFSDFHSAWSDSFDSQWAYLDQKTVPFKKVMTIEDMDYLPKSDIKAYIAKGGDVPTVIYMKETDEYLLFSYGDNIKHAANKELAFAAGGDTVEVNVIKFDDFIADMQTGEISLAGEDVVAEILAAEAGEGAADIAAMAEEAVIAGPADFGVDPDTLKGKFVQALIDKPMTNAEIKALDWNTSGNLHGDIFKKLKDKGLAGTYKGKKWISLTGKPPASLVEAGAEAIVEEAAPTIKTPKKFKIEKHFDNVKARGYAQADMDYLLDASNAHLSEMNAKYSGIAKLQKGRPKLGGLRLDNGVTIQEGGGKVGKYSASKRTVSIAGELSKEHSLTMGAYNASGDYYGVLRHEYGHHLWDISKTGTATNRKMIDDFMSLHTDLTKKHGNNFWASRVSQYASGVDDAFAEAFSSYTSPLYKKGKLPKEVENFFDHWMTGKKANYAVDLPKPKTLEKANPKALFRDKKHQQTFNKYYKQYTEAIDSQGIRTAQDAKKVARRLYKTDIKNTWVHRSASDWQGSTNTYGARKLKFKAEQIENRTIKTRITKMSHTQKAELWLEAERSSSEDYIRAKALTKAYYDYLGKKSVKLYRGIGGSNGSRYRKIVRDLQASTPNSKWGATKVLIEEDSLVGYTTSTSTAHSFGEVIVTRNVDVNDILLSDHIWTKSGYISEKEYIMLGGNYEISLNNLSL